MERLGEGEWHDRDYQIDNIQTSYRVCSVSGIGQRFKMRNGDIPLIILITTSPSPGAEGKIRSRTTMGPGKDSTKTAGCVDMVLKMTGGIMQGDTNVYGIN